MIRVQYKDHLSPGLNGKAEQSARGTTVYLVPGLTGRQRRAALRRLRQEASRGCGPALPGADLTVALAADRFRVGVRNATAVIRLHPAGSLLPTAVAALLMTLFVFASVSARMGQVSQSPGGPGGPIAPASGAATVIGYPALAQANLPADPDPAAQKAGAPGPLAPWSLAASSGSASRHAPSRHRAQNLGTEKLCGPAGDRAGVADRAPGTGEDAACRPKPRLPWPPPPGGWPHFWRPEHAAPPGSPPVPPPGSPPVAAPVASSPVTSPVASPVTSPVASPVASAPAGS